MLYRIPIYDTKLKRRELSVVVNDGSFELEPYSGTIYQEEKEVESFGAALSEVVSYLGFDDWRYIEQIYFGKVSEMLGNPEIVKIFTNAKKGTFPFFQSNVAESDKIFIGDVSSGYDSGWYDYASKTGDTTRDWELYSAATIGANAIGLFGCQAVADYNVIRSDPIEGITKELYGCSISFPVFSSDIITNDGKWNFESEVNVRYITVSFNSYYDRLIFPPLKPYLIQASISITGTETILLPEFIKSALDDTPAEMQPKNEDDNDPYGGDNGSGGGGDNSSTGGGQGDDDDGNNRSKDSEPNPVPSLPSISATDTGFITLFNPSSAQLKSLASYMWGQNFDIDLFKKIVADPIDVILGLSIVPVAIQGASLTEVKVGNIGTGISMLKCPSQYVELNCGSIKINEYWKAYLDYSPYTKLSIFLPYIGSQELDIDILQKNTLGVVYHIDILSGGCVAFVTGDGDVVAQFSGQCAISVPITSKDFTQTIIAITQLVAGGIGAIATGGLSAPVTAASIAGQAPAMASSAANVITSKPHFPKSGNVSGSNGLLGSQRPYIILERPKQCIPKYQNKYTGYPSYITERIGLLSGYTQMQDVHLNFACEDEERNEILELLRNGVIL